MVKIDFYGGVDEIGGNKILVHEAQTSLLLDFGMSFNQAGLYFSEFLQPRKANGIMDFMELGLLPEIKGIYREDYLKHCGMECSDEPAVDGLLLSHAHMDHSAYIHHLREDIPLYMSEESHLILKVLEETSTVSFADILHLKRDFHFVPKKTGEGYKKLSGKDAAIDRDITTVKPYEAFEIGDFKIKSAPVDHSLPGAAAYLLESDGGMTVYSGDLRFHGRHPEITQKFVKEAKKSNPNVMMCEGTRMGEERTETEQDIENRATELITDFGGPVIVNFPVRDLDRLLTFHNVARAADRTLVVNLKQAYMLNLFKGRGYPEIDEVAVYVPRRAWGLLGEDSFACFDGQWISSSEMEHDYVNSQYKKWERDFMEWENTVNYMDMRDEPEKYLFRCDNFELKELIDIKPENGLYIKSMTEPFDDEMMISERRVENWLKRFDLCPMHKMHVSGHASGPELIEMIREVEPEILYPIHTEHKEMFKVLEDDGIKVVYPERA